MDGLSCSRCLARPAKAVPPAMAPTVPSITRGMVGPPSRRFWFSRCSRLFGKFTNLPSPVRTSGVVSFGPEVLFLYSRPFFLTFPPPSSIPGLAEGFSPPSSADPPIFWAPGQLILFPLLTNKTMPSTSLGFLICTLKTLFPWYLVFFKVLLAERCLVGPLRSSNMVFFCLCLDRMILSFLTKHCRPSTAALAQCSGAFLFPISPQPNPFHFIQ